MSLFRTKYLAILSVLVVSSVTVGLAASVLRGYDLSSTPMTPASVIFVEPLEAYPASVEEQGTDNSSFIDALRRAYVPPPAQPEPVSEPEPQPEEVPIAVATSNPYPMADITELHVATGTQHTITAPTTTAPITATTTNGEFPQSSYDTSASSTAIDASQSEGM